MASTPTPAQLAARKTFADMARSGAFKKRAAPKRKANPQEDFSQPAAPKGPKGWPKKNPSKAPVGSQRLGTRIARLVHEGYPFKQAEAIAIAEEIIKPRADKLRAALKFARELLNYPEPLRVTKKGVVRRNPIGHVGPAGYDAWAINPRRRKNPTLPAHRAPSGYAVHRVLASGEPGATLGKFPSLALAKEYAAAYATAHKCQVGIVGKK
jgi:hypothetical protein